MSELHEIAHMDGGIVASELHADGALGRIDDGDLVAVGLVFRGVHGHKMKLLLFEMKRRAPYAHIRCIILAE